MSKKRTYTDFEFAEAVKTSTSIAQVLQKLFLKPAGGNYRIAKNRIRSLGLDSSHFKGKAHNKGKTYTRQPLEVYLNNEIPIQSHKLKLRLIKENVLELKCYECELTTWRGKPIPLELEHINGNHYDNTLSNLTILCPNCHAQTSTYRGKNKSKRT